MIAVVPPALKVIQNHFSDVAGTPHPRTPAPAQPDEHESKNYADQATGKPVALELPAHILTRQ